MDKREVISAMFLIITLILLIFVNQNIASGENANIVINEVMYNPISNDNYNEWIELYNPTNQFINVSGWNITDNYACDFLEGDNDHGNGTTRIPPHGYAIIADRGTRIYENFSVNSTAIRLYVDDSSIGNGLGNEKDRLILENSNGGQVDAVEWGYNYTEVPGTPIDLVDEGHSLARNNDSDANNSFIDNSATEGGGARIRGGSTVINNEFRGNEAISEGGGLKAWIWQKNSGIPGPCILTNNTLSGNSAPIGGGLYVELGAQEDMAKLYNNIICPLCQDRCRLN